MLALSQTPHISFLILLMVNFLQASERVCERDTQARVY